MIYDSLKNSEIYCGANSRFAQAFAFIEKAVTENYPAGRYEIDGDNLYAMVQQYNTNPVANAKFEAHKRYIDIQYIVSGEELMKAADISKGLEGTQYDEVKDFMLFEKANDPAVLLVKQGEFAIFFPHDIHMPGVAPDDKPAAARKIVVKVKV